MRIFKDFLSDINTIILVKFIQAFTIDTHSKKQCLET